MTILYLIRHGETGGNYEGRFQGIIDNPLNEYGIRQAKMLGEAFQSFQNRCAVHESFAAGQKDSRDHCGNAWIGKTVSNCG